MNKNISKIIDNLITECECDSRIESGVFDLYNTDHLVVISEHMEKLGISENEIENFIFQAGVVEGKYPERQAYNKEGWLVTFPSKEYRDAAIKKRTHFTSDPTHGKGGMNLYYKRRGKQKRQTQQVATTTEPVQPQAIPQQPVTEPAPIKKRSPEQEKAYQDAVSRQKTPSKQQDAALFDYIASKNKKFKADSQASQPSTATDNQPAKPIEPAGGKPNIPAVDVPVVATPPEEYATVSKKFATQKGWTVTEYGEYRDAEGNPVAVVGLSGEVVPIRSNDREEYKIFAEKSKA